MFATGAGSVVDIVGAAFATNTKDTAISRACTSRRMVGRRATLFAIMHKLNARGVHSRSYGTRNPKNLPFPSMVELSAAVHGREVETFE